MVGVVFVVFVIAQDGDGAESQYSSDDAPEVDG